MSATFSCIGVPPHPSACWWSSFPCYPVLCGQMTNQSLLMAMYRDSVVRVVVRRKQPTDILHMRHVSHRMSTSLASLFIPCGDVVTVSCIAVNSHNSWCYNNQLLGLFTVYCGKQCYECLPQYSKQSQHQVLRLFTATQ